MIRKSFYLTQRQALYLRTKNELTLSEHIRRAIDQYIADLELKNASTSPSISVKKGK